MDGVMDSPTTRAQAPLFNQAMQHGMAWHDVALPHSSEQISMHGHFSARQKASKGIQYHLIPTPSRSSYPFPIPIPIAVPLRIIQHTIPLPALPFLSSRYTPATFFASFLKSRWIPTYKYVCAFAFACVFVSASMHACLLGCPGVFPPAFRELCAGTRSRGTALMRWDEMSGRGGEQRSRRAEGRPSEMNANGQGGK